MNEKQNPDPRISELLELAATEGLALPCPIETILLMEDCGAVVDLHTGRIHAGAADLRYQMFEWPEVQR
jgi:hypothetical protein